MLIIGCQKQLQIFPKKIEEVLEKSVERGFDGIVVSVNQGGATSLYAEGWKNRENQIPATPHDLFKIASISKLYIAAATTKLIASQDILMENTLLDLIPEVEGKIENAEDITVKMMLQHRSGIPEYIYHPDFESDTEETYMETVSLIYHKKADFEPNKKYAYSNTNYLLIGEILDRTLGYSHHEFIKNEILIPNGLTNTYNLYSDVDSKLVMSGYLKGYTLDVKSWDHTRPGGSMIASAEDVAKFLRILIDGGLFTDKEQAIYSNVYEYGHTGWLPGYTSIARYHSDIDAVVIQFVNTSGKKSFWRELENVYDQILRGLKRR